MFDDNFQISGLYMFDCGSTIYLWQGWIEPDSEIQSEGTGSGLNTGSGNYAETFLEPSLRK